MNRDSGGSVRVYNLAKGLAATANDVHVILPKYQAMCERWEGVTVQGLKGLSPKAVLETLRKFAKVKRPTSLYLFDLVFVFRVSRLLREADIIQIEQQFTGALLIPFIKRVLKKPVVVDCHDVFQTLLVRNTSLPKRMLELFLEKLAYRNADLLLVVSENEKGRLISSGCQSCKIVVVPNGVDTTSFQNTSEQLEIRKKYRLEDYQIVVFIGNFSYLPNFEALQLLSSSIAPRVTKEINRVKFLAVGRMQNKLQLPGIEFTGFVDNVSNILSISDVAVAPLLHGSGTRLKILEYLSCGLPVVSTSVGAEGLDVEDGTNIFIVDNLEGFALRIVELLKNRKLSKAIGEAGRAVAVNYDWKLITNRLEISLSSFLSKRG